MPTQAEMREVLDRSGNPQGGAPPSLTSSPPPDGACPRTPATRPPYRRTSNAANTSPLPYRTRTWWMTPCGFPAERLS